MNQYDRMAKIIRYLDERLDEQPELNRLAKMAGLSPFHFHREFTRWVGVTPKDFVQCLTLEHARRLLKSGESVLDTALQAGLSGPSRLHDLSVTLEAASPGEIKSGGDGLTISYGFAQSPFGICLVAETGRGICHLAFVAESPGKDRAVDVLRGEWPRANFIRSDKKAAAVTAQMFDQAISTGEQRTLRAWVKGTEFQIRVWRALLNVPRGSLISYKQLAAMIDRPTAVRAAASAVASNSIAYLIPCHRVIRETGVISGYRWRPGRKRALIAWESAITHNFR